MKSANTLGPREWTADDINRVPCSTSSDVIGVGGQAARSYSDVSAMFQGSSAS